MSSLRGKIGIIGVGNMGEALVSGMLKAGLIDSQQIKVSDLDAVRLKKIEQKYRVKTTLNNLEVVNKTTIIILAVKPQVMDSVLREVGNRFRAAQTVISIAAGISTRHLEKFIPQRVAVVRVMPNTPALLGEAATGICGGRYARERDLQIADEILSAVGKVFRVKEKLMDAVTGLSGSGPAYLFLVMEALIGAGQSLGLKKRVSEGLVKQTFLGTAKLAERGEPFVLRKRVTSPGGTTEAAIKFLEKKKIKEFLAEAVKVATARSRELGKGR